MKKLILCDYSWMSHRFHHVHKDMKVTYDNKEIFTGTIFGFARFVESVYSRFSRDEFRIIFCLDKRSDRKDIFEDYKANRNTSLKEEVSKEDEYITSLMSLVEFVSFAYCDNKEADDVLASLALEYKDKYDEVIIYSGDNDMLQLIDEGIHVTREFTRTGFLYLGQEYITKKFGDILPCNLLKLRSLLGDPSDNIPAPTPGLKKAFLNHFIINWNELGLDEALDEKLYQTKIKGITDNLAQLKLLKESRANIIFNYRLMSLIKYKDNYLTVSHFKREKNYSLLDILQLSSYKRFLESLSEKSSSSISQITM